MSSYGALGVDVANISGDTGAATDVVEGELADAGVELEEERQRLADTTAGTEDDDLRELFMDSCVNDDAAETRPDVLDPAHARQATHVAGRGREGPALGSARD